MPYECFADEIAIDFPSVGKVVDRIRDAFLGEHDADEVMMTEVCVSSREALGGMVVPLEVSVRGTCPTCGGRGESWTERCASCRGTGDALFQHPVRLTLPAGVADGARFRFRVQSPHVASVRVEVRVAIRSSAV
jgi:predicted RNA-binding Zn-ribbon protein involved in translation (DUF1610 family)